MAYLILQSINQSVSQSINKNLFFINWLFSRNDCFTLFSYVYLLLYCTI